MARKPAAPQQQQWNQQEDHYASKVANLDQQWQGQEQWGGQYAQEQNYNQQQQGWY
jgi:hypothetical protein